MNRLAAAGITGWSWVGALGRAHSNEPGVSLHRNLDAKGLASHAAEFGIPGYSGKFPGELAPLPVEHQHRDSRCARLLYEALVPLEPKLARLKEQLGSERVAVVLGSSTGGIDATEIALRHERQTGSLPEGYRFRDIHPYDSLLDLVGDVLGLEGPRYIVSTACSSAGKAMAAAQRLLHAGLADAALVGGADALCEMTVRGFSGLGVLSEEPCRPFEKSRTGISIGEGAALLILEANSNASIQLLGAGECSDAYHATTPHPEGIGAELAMRACLEMAGLTPNEVDYLNAHGTGTDKNDAMEALAISRVLGDGLSFSSTKHKTGHQLGTAGATEAIVCVQAVAEGRLPPEFLPGPEEAMAWDPDLAVRPHTTKRNVEVALSNSFAFGGSNVTVAVGTRRKARPPRVCAAECFVEGMALWTPHFANVTAWREGRRSEAVKLPPAETLGVRTRGRSSVLTRAFAEVYGQLEKPYMRHVEPGVGVPTIYASCFGEMETTLKLLDQMDEEPVLSPIRFQGSVHNTASGRISLETKNRAFSTALAAGPATFAMALLEAQAWLTCHGGEILVLVAEEELPPRLDPDLRFPPLGVGLHLSASPSDSAWSSLSPVRNSPGADLILEDARLAEYESAPPVGGLALIHAILQKHGGEIAVGPQFSCRISPLC